jgi:pimeloyl-ACP methyl ester carboxylesterase
MLHGFPQTWYEWRLVMPALAERYSVVAPDLRGLGDSSRPAAGYDKHTVAGDIWRLVDEHLGAARFFLVGHDWGGPVAYRLAVEHPDAVRRLVILDVMIPGDGTSLFATSGGRWHHGFHQTPELPESLILGREQAYLSYFFRHFGASPDAIPAAAVEEYVRCYAAPGAMAAGLAYYRATAQDIADNEAAIDRGKLAMPVLALGGAEGMGRAELCLESMARVAENVTGGAIPGAGHWLPEEVPDALAARLLDFFGAEP